jgi:hypothetical protein
MQTVDLESEGHVGAPRLINNTGEGSAISYKLSSSLYKADLPMMVLLQNEV